MRVFVAVFIERPWRQRSSDVMDEGRAPAGSAGFTLVNVGGVGHALRRQEAARACVIAPCTSTAAPSRLPVSGPNSSVICVEAQRI